ncbi:MAG: hypothetical protein EZS28_026612 [Streblomastix strix]|uniref:Uncharacterized protein n=1 Tax=Streblomastix strix TaxID=222440 RepID=A0A5J4V6R4_9EUKA|nr:MAG: hypothetical protein EZS28_026612 [Streblomastix strix]
MEYDLEEDEQSFQIRQRSRECLISIQKSGDESDQAEVVNVGYIRVFVICLSLAGGTGEHLDSEIYLGLQHISEFISQLHLGRNDYFLPYFSSQPSLSKRCIEQIEEEGGNEEIDSQLINKGNEDLNIKKEADSVKGLILNLLIDEKNPKPSWYYFYI